MSFLQSNYDICIFTSKKELPIEKIQIDLACRFYGLKSLNIEISVKSCTNFNQEVIERNFKAIIITAKALELFKPTDLEMFLTNASNSKGVDVPLLIIGITPILDPLLLKSWLGRSLEQCSEFTTAVSSYVLVGSNRKVAMELTGQKLPYRAKRTFGLILSDPNDSEILLQTESREGYSVPLFIRTRFGHHQMFSSVRLADLEVEEGEWRYNPSRFIEIAPLMMFLKYTCSQNCWHTPFHFANLTIDDPWLCEPYGHLSFSDLLSEMNLNNFHTTIGFIPWNYDRSESKVVSLLRQNPRRFSICFHGNNHDRYEFFRYEKKAGDAYRPKPLQEQERNICQAIARMQEFKHLTDLSCDQVMVFPVGIAPNATLLLLKKYGFKATVNYSNVPLGESIPADHTFPLRTITCACGSIPALRRFYPKHRSESDMAVDLFLDNPLLFMAHHDDFKQSIQAFNDTASIVNKIDPEIHWCGLQEIAQHLYLIRMRPDAAYDVYCWSADVILTNTSDQEKIYYIEKEEPIDSPVEKITIEDVPVEYQHLGGRIRLVVTIPSQESKRILIKYRNSPPIPKVDLRKHGLRIRLLRFLCDFRDRTLSCSSFGRWFTDRYYASRLHRLARRDRLFWILGVVRILIMGFLLLLEKIIRSCTARVTWKAPR